MKYEELSLIKSNFNLSPDDYNALTLLYAPLMGPKALSIYLCMSAFLNRGGMSSEEYPISQFCDLYNYTPTEFNNALKKLEGIGLLKRYIELDKYIFILLPPKSAKSFLTDGVLGVYLYGTVGEACYKNILNHFTLPKLVMDDYIDKTLKFDEVYTDKVANNDKEILAELFGKPNPNDVEINNLEFDYNKFEHLIIEEFIPTNKKQFKRAILNTAYVYSFDEYEMASITKEAIDKLGYYNPTLIRKKASIKYLFIHDSAPKLKNKYAAFGDYKALETITSVNLLNEVITDDSKTGYFADYLKQIDELYIKLNNIPRGIINCMIIYALQNNDYALPKNTYFIKMADTWTNDYQIKTIEDAVKFIVDNKIEAKKTARKSPNKKEKPADDWVNERIDKVEEGFKEL